MSGLNALCATGCVADSTGGMVAKGLVCQWLVRERCYSQYYEWCAVQVMNAAPVTAELLFRGHSPGERLVSVFLCGAIVLHRL